MENMKNFGEFINEDLVRLRKLTFKSIIGFGINKDLTVQDLCTLNKEDELINIYYMLGNIDFSDEVKERLCINERRSIKKPGKDRSAYYFFKGEILSDIIERRKEKGEGQKGLRGRLNYMDKSNIGVKNMNQKSMRQNKTSPFGFGKRQ
jgi:hypothetical protein